MNRYEQAGLAIVIAAFAILILIRIFFWFRSGPTKPDPWDDSVNRSIENEEAAPVCVRCFTPQEHATNFCPHCGSAVGDYNNLMPFEMVFSQGEVFRNGLSLHLRHSILIITGYIIASGVAYSLRAPLIFFLPLYWWLFVRNLRAPHEPVALAATAE